MSEQDSNLFGGSVDRSKLEEMRAAAGDDPERLRQVDEVEAQVKAVEESDAAAEEARQASLDAQSTEATAETAEGTAEPQPEATPEATEDRDDGLYSVGGGWYEVVANGQLVDKVRGQEAAQELYDQQGQG